MRGAENLGLISPALCRIGSAQFLAIPRFTLLHIDQGRPVVVAVPRHNAAGSIVSLRKRTRGP